MSETIVAPKPPRSRTVPVHVGFELVLDRSTYARTRKPATLTATVILRSPAQGSVSLTFSTAQEFDIELRDASGAELGLWSRGRVFAGLVRTIDFTGEHVWVATMALPEAQDAVHAQSYTATAFLTPSFGRLYSATVGFTIRGGGRD